MDKPFYYFPGCQRPADQSTLERFIKHFGIQTVGYSFRREERDLNIEPHIQGTYKIIADAYPYIEIWRRT